MYAENHKDKEKMMEDKKYRGEQGILLTKKKLTLSYKLGFATFKSAKQFSVLNKISLVKVYVGEGCLIRLVTVDALQCTENVVC